MSTQTIAVVCLSVDDTAVFNAAHASAMRAGSEPRAAFAAATNAVRLAAIARYNASYVRSIRACKAVDETALIRAHETARRATGRTVNAFAAR